MKRRIKSNKKRLVINYLIFTQGSYLQHKMEEILVSRIKKATLKQISKRILKMNCRMKLQVMKILVNLSNLIIFHSLYNNSQFSFNKIANSNLMNSKRSTRNKKMRICLASMMKIYLVIFKLK